MEAKVQNGDSQAYSAVPSEEDAKESATEKRWGYACCRPQWCQRFCNNPIAFTIWLSWFSMLAGFVVNGINNVNTSTVERRYNLASSQVSLISSSYDIAAGLFVLPITYWGAHAHQPRMLAFAALVVAAGSLVMTIPQWATEPYKLGKTIADSCSSSGNSTTCEPGDETLSNYLYVFMLGQFLHGIGGTTLHTLGIVFIDGHVRNNESPAYQGVIAAFSTLGPALGYILGGKLLTIYVDSMRVDVSSLSISTEDPRFVGAWWIGFLINGCLALTVFLTLLPYPSELPQKAAVQKERVSEAHQDGSEAIAQQEGFGRSARDIPLALKILLKNPVNMLITGAGVTEGIIITGVATFMPKFIQNQYGQTAALAAMLGGAITVPGAAGGQVITGLVCSKAKLKIRGMLRYSMGLSVACIALSACFLARCPSDPVVGVRLPYPEASGDAGLSTVSACNAECGCTMESYEPICSHDNHQYFSPCHAGCVQAQERDGEKVYSSCSCIHGNSSASWQHGGVAMAVPGKCPSDCKMMYVFLPLFFFIILTTFMKYVPAINMTIRCIPDNQRAFGLGLRWMFVRFFGMVVGPVLFGAVFDSTCLLWQDKCGTTGSCWVYDNDLLGIRITVTIICLKLASLVFYSLAYMVYKPPPSQKEVSGQAEEDRKPEDIPMVDNASKC